MRKKPPKPAHWQRRSRAARLSRTCGDLKHPCLELFSSLVAGQRSSGRFMASVIMYFLVPQSLPTPIASRMDAKPSLARLARNHVAPPPKQRATCRAGDLVWNPEAANSGEQIKLLAKMFSCCNIRSSLQNLVVARFILVGRLVE